MVKRDPRRVASKPAHQRRHQEPKRQPTSSETGRKKHGNKDEHGTMDCASRNDYPPEPLVVEHRLGDLSPTQQAIDGPSARPKEGEQHQPVPPPPSAGHLHHS